MSKISTYSLADSPLLLSDRLIGTEAFRPSSTNTPLATKNFSLGELLQLFSANFPAATLQAVLDAGNIATQDMFITGTIDVTLIKPTNIEDILGSQGTNFQFLSKATTGINWVNLPIDNLQAVLDVGNTATQNINLTGNITSTKIIPGNIQDDTSSIGTVGQVLSKTSSGIRWITNPASFTAGLNDVLSVGNTGVGKDITLTSEGDGIFTYGGVLSSVDNTDGNVGSAAQLGPYALIVGDNTGQTIVGRYSISQGDGMFSTGLIWDTLTSNETLIIPNKSGTIALTSDIPPSSPLTTKGDLYTFSTVNARIGVGTNGQVLTADSTQTTGLKWSNPTTVNLTTTGYSGPATFVGGVLNIPQYMGATTRKNANNSTNSNINYCGVAVGLGVSESSAVWTITRITIASSGSVTIGTATNVAWTNRESVIYT